MNRGDDGYRGGDIMTVRGWIVGGRRVFPVQAGVCLPDVCVLRDVPTSPGIDTWSLWPGARSGGLVIHSLTLVTVRV